MIHITDITIQSKEGWKMYGFLLIIAIFLLRDVLDMKETGALQNSDLGQRGGLRDAYFQRDVVF